MDGPFSTAKPDQLLFTPQSVVFGNDTVEIIRQSAVDIKYLKKKGASSLPFLISTEPLVNKSGTTNLNLVYITNRWNAWNKFSSIEKKLNKALKSSATIL
jgi:hypothetical protein